MHQIAAVATQMKEVQTDAFKEYARQVRANARAIGEALVEKGYSCVKRHNRRSECNVLERSD